MSLFPLSVRGPCHSSRSHADCVDLGLDASVVPAGVASPTAPLDSIKRTKLDNPPPSVFTLALTVDSDDASIDTINVQDLYRANLDTRPASSDSADSTASSKKRAFSDLLHVDPPKFRMSRKKPRQHPPADPSVPKDYVVFDAVREPLQAAAEKDVDANGVPRIRPSGIPDEIQWRDNATDVAIQDMLQSYLTVDHQNRTYVNIKDEYVYDIYYRTAVSPATVPTDANFGVLVYESEAELVEDEEEVLDDEDADSNSEGYYQNSYPDEDEWAGDGWGSDEEEEEAEYGQRRVRKLAFDSDDLEFASDSGAEDLYSYPEED